MKKVAEKFNYQLVVMVDPKLEKKKREEVLAGVAEEIKKESGTGKVKKSNWGVKKLAYEIKGNDSGDFWIFDIETSSGLKLNGLNVFLNRQADIKRFLLLKI